MFLIIHRFCDGSPNIQNIKVIWRYFEQVLFYHVTNTCVTKVIDIAHPSLLRWNYFFFIKIRTIFSCLCEGPKRWCTRVNIFALHLFPTQIQRNWNEYTCACLCTGMLNVSARLLAFCNDLRSTWHNVRSRQRRRNWLQRLDRTIDCNRVKGVLLCLLYFQGHVYLHDANK